MINITNVPGHDSNAQVVATKANPYIRRNSMKTNMGMVNMERPKPQIEETKLTEPMQTDSYEKYPYGLRFTLNDEDLNKLGIDINDYDVNSEVKIDAKAIITQVSSRQSNNDGSNKISFDNSLEFQITDLSINDMGNFNESFKEAINEE